MIEFVQSIFGAIILINELIDKNLKKSKNKPREEDYYVIDIK